MIQFFMFIFFFFFLTVPMFNGLVRVFVFIFHADTVYSLRELLRVFLMISPVYVRERERERLCVSSSRKRGPECKIKYMRIAIVCFRWCQTEIPATVVVVCPVSLYWAVYYFFFRSALFARKNISIQIRFGSCVLHRSTHALVLSLSIHI